MRANPKATVAAEKLHAVTVLGMANTRMNRLEPMELGHEIGAIRARSVQFGCPSQ